MIFICREAKGDMTYLTQDLGIRKPYPIILMVSDQREWQKVAPKNAFPMFFAAILNELKSFSERRKIADLTYGRGLLHIFTKPRTIIHAIDVKRWNWIVDPDLFLLGRFEMRYKELDEEDYDFVVFDPPFPCEATSRSRNKPWLYHGADSLGVMLKYLPKVALRLLKPNGFLVVKWMDHFSHGLKKPSVFDLVSSLSKSFKLRNYSILAFRKNG